MSFRHPSLAARAAAAAAAAALVVATLAGCSSGGSPAGTAVGSVAQTQSGAQSAGGDTVLSGAADVGDDAATGDRDESDGTGSSDTGEDEGIVTVEVASGPHAGTHTRSGNLQCATIGDGRWIVFAPGEGEAEDVAMLTVYSVPLGIDRTVADTPYPDSTQLLEMKFGSPIAAGDNAITISDEAGGSVDIAVPSLDESGRPVYHFVATTADGVGMKIAATPPECPPY